MLYVCPDCRNFDVEKPVRDEGSDGRAIAVCPDCGREFEFRYWPLRTLEGALGVGKSVTAGRFDRNCPLAVFEGDLLVDLLGGELSWGAICVLSLRICLTLHATGQRALCVGGLYPHDPADSPETRYFSRFDRCALVCDDDDLESRLRGRPHFQKNPEDVDEFLDVNRWYREEGPPAGIETVNTTDADPDRVARRIAAWIETTIDA